MNKTFIIIVIIIIFTGFGLGIFWYLKDKDSANISSTPSNKIAKSVTEANNQFAIDLFNKYQKNTGNIFYSPWSISSAIAIAFEGSKGNTQKEIANVMHYPLDSNIRQSEFKKITSELNNPTNDFKISSANALWLDKNHKFEDVFTNIAEQFYFGKIANLDFTDDPKGSENIINKWVSDKTNNKITNIIPPNSLNSSLRLVITNAIYFYADWVNQFTNEKTETKEFKTISGVIQTPIMNQQGKFDYMENDDMQALEMPYKGNEVSMVIFLPKKDIATFQKKISLDNINNWLSQLEKDDVDVSLPKFQFETEYMMKNTLAELGMPLAFSNTANFSGISLQEDLKISEVIHKAYVIVDEKGTEATAVTAVTVSLGLAHTESKYITFNANHPFIFLIKQNSNNNILFIGRLDNPSN